MKAEKPTELVPVSETEIELAPILAGRATAAVAAQVQDFYKSVAEIFERWVTRREHAHAARLPAGCDGFCPLPQHPLARRINQALHGLGRGCARVSRLDAR